MSAAQQFYNFALATKCTDLIPPRELFACEDTSSLMFVLENIRRIGCHSLPCVNSHTKHVEGMVDVLDIVCSVYEICDLERFNKHGSFNAGEVASAFIDTTHLADALSRAVAGQMVNRGAPAKGDLVRDQPAQFSGPTEPTAFVTLDDNLLQVIVKLGRDKRHRVPVVDSTDLSHIQNVITQSDLCSYFVANLDKIPEEVRQMPIGQLGSHHPVSVGMTASLAEALYLFRVKKVHALAVEDRHGRFVGQLTAHNFVSHAANFNIYGLAVDEFFQLDGNAPNPELLPADMKLEDALKLITQKRRGRLWIGADRVVSAVVSLRDILHAIETAMIKGAPAQRHN